MERQYNMKQTAEILGVKVRTVREWLRSGKITGKKYTRGGVWFFSQSEIDRLQSNMTDK